MGHITLQIDAKRYTDHDDCLAAAAADAASEYGLEGWDLSPRWADAERDSILIEVPLRLEEDRDGGYSSVQPMRTSLARAIVAELEAGGQEASYAPDNDDREQAWVYVTEVP